MAGSAERLRSFLRARWFPLLLGVSLVVLCLPVLVVRAVPFHDAPGVIGLASVFSHLGHPETRVHEFYQVDYGAYPSVAYFGWAWLAALVGIPADVALNAFTALFCLAGPPLAMVVLLRAFGRPPWLSLLTLPVVWHQQIWFGFLGSAAALTGLLLALAFARRLLEPSPSPTPKRRLGDHLGLAGALLFVALAHPFTLALTLAIVAPVLVMPVVGEPSARRRWGARALRLACFLPTAAFLGSWARTFFGGHARAVANVTEQDATAEQFAGAAGRAVGFTDQLLNQLGARRPPLLDDLRLFGQWLGGGYAGGADEVVVVVGVLSLVACLAVGVRRSTAAADGPAPPPEARLATASTVWLGGAALVLALGYLFLPNKVHWPTYWWGVRVRCAVPLFLVAVVAVRVRPRGLPVWAAAPAVAAALFFGGFVTRDFRGHWNGRVLDGFREAVQAIPPGRTVLAFPALVETHYAHAHPYLIQYYVVWRGGRALPYLMGHPGSYWVTARPLPEAPPWGDPRSFDWHEHGLGYEYFVLEVPEPPAKARDPLASVPPGAVKLLSARGRWRVYRRERVPDLVKPPGAGERP